MRRRREADVTGASGAAEDRAEGVSRHSEALCGNSGLHGGSPPGCGDRAEHWQKRFEAPRSGARA